MSASIYVNLLLKERRSWLYTTVGIEKRVGVFRYAINGEDDDNVVSRPWLGLSEFW